MANSETEHAEGMRETMITGLVDALNDKTSQLDIDLKDVEIEMINAKIGLRVSGTLTLSVNFRALDDREKRAQVDYQVARLHK
jgi:hypothetical protein